MSVEARREFCRTLLNSGALAEITEDKFDVMKLAGLVAGGEETEEAVKNVVHLRVAVPQQSLQIMNTFYPGSRFINGTDTSHPHATAYAHRVLDVQHFVRDKVAAGCKSMCDIGGNYTMHPKMPISRSIEIHCCTYRRGWSEHHRQTQRDVAVLQGAEETSKCHDGVQQCTFMASNGICVHVLPEIDPDDWPGIFERHKLESVTSVHHHPIDLDNYERKGYMPYPSMHWEVSDDDIVSFHFDNDSSFAYHHRLDYLREYARPWIRTKPGWDYVIYYEVKAIRHGMLYSEMTRIRKTQVTMHSPHTKLLYTGGETDVMIPVPVFNEKSGLAITNPAAYDTVYYGVPERIYTWCMSKGISNDTTNPDKPYSRNAMRDAVRVINRDRQLNGMAWSERMQMSTRMCEIIGDGIYTSVVMHTAYNKMTVAKLANQMQRMQRRWGHENMLKLMARTVTSTVLLPYILLCSELEDAVDVLRVALGAGVYSHEALVPPQHRTPYLVLGPVGIPTQIVETHPEAVREGGVDDTPDISSQEFKLNYYRMFKDQLPEDQRELLERDLFPDGAVDEAPIIPPVFVEDDDDIDDDLPSRKETYDEIVNNRDSWLLEFERLRAEADEAVFVDDSEKVPQVGTLQDVHKYDKQALFEYALHCFDLHQSVHKNAKEMCHRHWDGIHPRRREMDQDNEKDIGAVFIDVDEEGYLVGVPEGVVYDQVVDPYNMTFIDVQRKAKGMHVGHTTNNKVYSLNSLRIANSKRIGLVAMRAFKKGFDLSDVEIHLIDGIAGAGKTREITREFTIKDIFATAPRASAENVRKWCMTQDRFKQMKDAIGKQVRTMDSHLLAATPRIGERMFLDEGFMLPDGAQVLLNIRCRAKVVYISGDNAQIGMIDRGAGYGQLLYTKRMYFSSIKYLNVTDRCPQDATYILRDNYPLWRQPLIKTTSPIRRSIRVEVIPNAEADVYKQPIQTATVITFTQNDKANTAKHRGFIDAKKLDGAPHADEAPVRPVLTVHEAQGETYPFVIVQRLNKYSSTVFASKCHQYVAHSRHTVLLILRTVCDVDMCPFTKLMIRATNLTDEQLDEVVAEQTSSEVCKRVEAAKELVGKYVNLVL